MFSRTGVAAICAVFLCLGSILTPVPATAASSDGHARDIDGLLSSYHEQGRFMGTALVAEKGKVIHQAGYGMANIEWDIPNRPDIRFRLGSITKQFTSALILQLVEEGKIDLQAPISTYLPDYREDIAAQVTTHHLLTHTSGIPSYTSRPDFFPDVSRDPYTPEEFVQLFCSGDLEFEPGSQFRYNNSAYFMLGLIIEKITDKSYEENLQERIFDPLGMKDTGYDHHATIMARRAAGYSRVLDEYRNAPYMDMSLPYAAGSLYSTVEDLYVWDRALYTEKVLSAPSKKKMFTPVLNDYGYGWGIREVEIGDGNRKVKSIGHGGGINGFNTRITRLTDDQHLIVLLNNTDSAPLGEMTLGIAHILYDEPFEIPDPPLAPVLVRMLLDRGQEAAMAHYQTMAADYSEEEAGAIEGQLNNQGYVLLQTGDTDAAIQVFRFNVALFPESGNAYDSLGEALMTAGQREEAIRSYARSLELDPDNSNAVDMLQELMTMVAGPQ